MTTETFDLTNLPPKPGGTLNLPSMGHETAREPAPAAYAGASPYVSDFETPETVAEASDLDTLTSDLTAALDTFITIPFAERPGYAIRYAADISNAELEHFRKMSRTKGKVNSMKLDLLLLANKSVALVREGVDVTDDEGTPWNFRHREFIELLSAAAVKRGKPPVRTAAEAVKAFYVLDGVIDSTSNAVLAAAGWGQDQETLPDPTSGD